MSFKNLQVGDKVRTTDAYACDGSFPPGTSRPIKEGVINSINKRGDLACITCTDQPVTREIALEYLQRLGPEPTPCHHCKGTGREPEPSPTTNSYCWWKPSKNIDVAWELALKDTRGCLHFLNGSVISPPVWGEMIPAIVVPPETT